MDDFSFSLHLWMQPLRANHTLSEHRGWYPLLNNFIDWKIMGFFTNLFKKSNFFASEYTDKSLMPFAEVMNAHANWKTRINKLMEGTLGYSLDPDVLAQADDTELGRWILQSDSLTMSDESKNKINQLHKANVDLHQAASAIARHVNAGNKAEVAIANEQFVSASRQVMLLLRELAKEH